MADDTLVSVVRPNGKVYTPRRRPRAVLVEDEDWRTDFPQVVLVFGTHDVTRAYALASRLAAVEPKPLFGEQWYRLAMRNGEQQYVTDEERGSPALTFGVIDDVPRHARRLGEGSDG